MQELKSPFPLSTKADFVDNNHRIINYLRLSVTDRCNLRCIFGVKSDWTYDKFLPIKEGLTTIRRLGPIRPVNSEPLDGPAQRYTLEGAKGEIGVIGALSHRFCKKCNRIRLTADGHLRGCLFSEQESNIKTPLRQGKGNTHLLELITNAILNKPETHGLGIYSPRKCVRSMNSIGG